MDCVRSLNFEMQEADDEHFDTSSGCELSFETSSDNIQQVSPTFHYTQPKNDIFETPLPHIVVHSPPYKRVRSLRLFDSPHTPKTILEKSSAFATPALRMRLFPSTDKPRSVPSAYPKKEKPSANVNPFSPIPTILQLSNKKRTRSLVGSPEVSNSIHDSQDSEASDVEVDQPTKRVALQESNISRYHKEFLELELIGSGQFGSVYKCINRLDGCIYAIKKSTKPVTGSILEKRALNEVYAHAVLGRHEHVVRYYSAWAEDNHMIIQNEYCNGGSLADRILECPLTTSELRQLVMHVAEGLRYIHAEGLVHLDIKPGNIFISHQKKARYTNYDSADDGFEDLDESSLSEDDQIVYKIGDLGHVTSIIKPQVEDGDCRYISRELLNDDYSQLLKGDIFALALTVLEAAGSGPLPKNGPEWHSLRDGNVPQNVQLNEGFKDLIKLMIHPNHMLRPTPLQVLQHRAICPGNNKSRAQLRRELNAEKLKNEILHKQLVDAAKCIQSFAPADTKEVKAVTRLASRIMGKKFNRSSSTTQF